MARKRKTLPKNFQELIEKGNLEELKNVFDTCEINAKGGYDKSTAISFHRVPDELVRWLVENGLDIDEASYTYKETPLHQQASSGDISLFIELGTNINARDSS